MNPHAKRTAVTSSSWATRTIDADIGAAAYVMDRLEALGVDMDDVGATLEAHGVDSFHQSFAEVLDALEAKVQKLTTE